MNTFGAAAAFVTVLAWPAMAGAAVVEDCDFRADIRALAEPWEANTKTFASGRIRVALSDTGGEPACCSMSLVVLLPDPREPEMPAMLCKVVGSAPGLGFQSIDMATLASRYDPATGLTIEVLAKRYIDGVSADAGTLTVRINQKTGAVTAE